MLASHSSDALSVPPLGQVEPAEPEPPPAHSLGRVDEDVMGRSGQLVRPRSLDAGGVAGGRNWWRGWWLRFFLSFFSTFLVALDKKNQPKLQQMSKPQKKPKNNKKVAQNRPPSFQSWEAK